MLQDPCIALLRDLVSIDSINPSLVPGARGEADIAEAIAGHLRRLGLDVEMQEAAPGRPNVIGILEGRAPGRSIMFCGHMDTVGVDGMEAPFTPVERDGKLYGRGSQDMKSGIAAMIDAVRIVAERGLDRGRIIIAAVVDEEYESIGADALVARWNADLAIVTEPTDLTVGVAHKGFAWIEIETTGKAAHGSRPHEGRDAIVYMARVLGALEALDRELQARPPHPLMGTASLHASLISGGQELSSYPARCLLQMERRMVSGESGDTAGAEIAQILDRLARDVDQFRAEARIRFARPSYEVPAGHPLPQMVIDALHALGRRSERVGMSFWTDAAVLGAAGIPTVLFGPSGAGLHGRDEYVHIADVLVCRDVLASVASRLA
jgi:acetylornithine deacetylase